MKKIVVLAICLSSVVLMCGCSSATSSSSSQSTSMPSASAQVVNPIAEYASADELEQAVGIYLAVPSDATDVVYSSIDSSIAQVSFMLDGVDVSYRAEFTSAYEDISGMYYTWTNSEEFVDRYGCTNYMRYNVDEAAAIGLYYDVNGASYSVSMTGSSLSHDDIMSVYQKISDADAASDRTM